MASASLKAFPRKAISETEPMAAFAPIASILTCFFGSLLIIVTSWPFLISISANGLLMLPSEPVKVIFITHYLIVIAKLSLYKLYYKYLPQSKCHDKSKRAIDPAIQQGCFRNSLSRHLCNE